MALPSPSSSSTRDQVRAVLALYRAQAWAEAAEAALAARAAGVAHPVLHDVVAAHLRRLGDLEGALAEYNQALALDPDSPVLRLNVAACRLKTGADAEARNAYLSVLALRPDQAEAHYGLGVALDRLDEPDAARAAYEQAVTLSPDHGPALGALALSLLQARQPERARELAERALASRPGQVDAEMALARLDAEACAHRALRARVEALLARPDIEPPLRASLLLMLGDALDGVGAVDAAFAAYVEGKAMQRITPGLILSEDALATAQQACADFACAPVPPLAAAISHGAVPARTHVFLMGFARSGTTLLEQVLGSHPEVTGLEEPPTLQAAHDRFIVPSGGLARLAALDDDGVAALVADYWRRVEAAGAAPGGKVFVDKQPMAGIKLPLIARMFPKAKVLFAVRDPRDVVLSCFRRDFRLNPSTAQFTDLVGAARFYDATMRATMLFRERLELAVHEIRYERLVKDFRGEVGAACAFLGVEPHEDMTHFATRRRERPIRTPSAAQVERGIYADGIGQWRRYARHLEPVAAILEPWVDYYGYE